MCLTALGPTPKLMAHLVALFSLVMCSECARMKLHNDEDKLVLEHPTENETEVRVEGLFG